MLLTTIHKMQQKDVCYYVYFVYVLYVQHIRMYIVNHIFEATFYKIK